MWDEVSGSTIARAARRAALVGALVMVGGCGVFPIAGPSIRVQAEQAPWVDATKYHTYRWWAPPLEQGQRGYDQGEALLDWRVRDAVDRGLGARGYELTTSNDPDFVVKYGLSVEDAYTPSYRDYLVYRAEGGTKDAGEAFMGYERGTLTLEFYDLATRRLAWHASASAVVEERSGKRIHPAVQQMLERFSRSRP